MKRLGMAILVCAALSAGMFTGCAGASSSVSSAQAPSSTASSVVVASTSASASTTTASKTATTSGAVYQASDLFTDRDLEQTADTSNAKSITVTSGEDISITEEGVYVVSGNASDVTITVSADSSAKVQLVLDGLTVQNSDAPVIYVESADKVFVTTADGSTNNLSVTGTFATTAEDNFDGVIYAKDDIVLNGKGTLTINSTDNGIVGKDDVKVTGGTYEITATGHGIQGKDSVAISDGSFTITAGTDGIHSENSDDASLGYIYISGGDFNIKAGSDGIGATTVAQIDGGTIAINSAEGIEGTLVQINDGTVSVQATDDGINATTKSTAYSVKLEINSGTVNVDMGSGDTDALDSNGDLLINGGTVNITAQSPFDYDGTGALNGGTVTVNGQQVTELTSQMMGGGMGGKQGGMSGSRGSMGGSRGSMSQGSQQV